MIKELIKDYITNTRDLTELRQDYEELLGIFSETSAELIETRAKMFEYKSQTMHLNRALTKKNRKLKGKNETITKLKDLLKANGIKYNSLEPEHMVDRDKRSNLESVE